jgi:ubiquinone/menaquinone biosynthesis C-methylase UbiE
MDEFKLNPEAVQDAVYILSEINNEFESVYLKVREKERRIYSDKELKNLPFASNTNSHKKEWDLRAKSFLRFKHYLMLKKEIVNILDIGCGNGWFCGQLSKSFNHNFYCIDVNLTELRQGRRVFNSEQIEFIYADIFSAKLPDNSFDLIMINAAIQYFPDLKRLIDKLLTVLKDRGEIHIIDSPIYSKAEAESAKQRTRDYYSSMDFSKMTNYYYHHDWNELSEFNHKVLYNPLSFSSKFKKLIIKDSPFPWIRLSI